MPKLKRSIRSRAINAGDLIPRVGVPIRGGSGAKWAEALAQLGQLALESTDWFDLMNQAVHRLATTLQVDCVEILELNSDRKHLTLRAGYGWPSNVIGRMQVEAIHKSQAGFTLLANEPVVVDDIRSEKRFAASPLMLNQRLISGMSVVIGRMPKPYGVLGVHAREHRIFGDDEVRFLRTVANLLAAVARGCEADQANRDSTARVHAIVNTLVDGIITIDERGAIESLNPAAEKIFGYSGDEIRGRNVNVLMSDPYQREHDGYLANYLRTGKQRIIGIGREVSGLRKDGTTFPLDLAVSELQVSGKRMFTGIVRDITDRRRMEREILEAGAEEQRRIGQDLHDGLCQHLAGIAFAVEVLTQKLTARSAPEASSIRKIADMIDQSITQARDLARGLQPVTLDANGLVTALSALAERIEGMFHISCIFVCDGPCLLSDNNVATHLYRIAQEAISNAIKHGNAHTVIVDLSVTGEEISLAVKDDGAGIANSERDKLGMGLRSMDYRARVIGGTLRVLPGEKGGTTVICTVRNKDAQAKTAKRRDNGKKVASDPDKEKHSPRRRSSNRPRASG